MVVRKQEAIMSNNSLNFAQTYPQKIFVQEVLAQLNWYSNITIIQKIKDEDIRRWYIEKI